MLFAALTPDFFMLCRSVSNGIATSTAGGIPYSMFISSIHRVRCAILHLNSPSHLNPGCGLAIYSRYHKPVAGENCQSRLFVVRYRNTTVQDSREFAVLDKVTPSF